MTGSPSTAVRARVKEVVEAEFTDKGWEVRSDRLPRSYGHKGVDGVACYPVGEEVQVNRYQELTVPVALQIYLAYEAKVDEDQAVDPAIIEEIGHRLRGAFNGQTEGDGDFWFLNVIRIEYPPDPTGNMTRLEALIQGRALNESIA